MRPGCFTFCGSCVYLDQPMHRQGHPSPCGRQFWDGPHLVKPDATAAGCDEFREPLDDRDLDLLDIFNGAEP